MPPQQSQLDDDQMIVPARDMPFIAIERDQQIFCCFANFDAMAGPKFNCLRVLHSPLFKRKDRVTMQNAFQNGRDSFGSGVNSLNCQRRFVFQIRR